MTNSAAAAVVEKAGTDQISAMALAERAGATFVQDWDAGTSTAEFPDGSRLVFCGRYYELG